MCGVNMVLVAMICIRVTRFTKFCLITGEHNRSFSPFLSAKVNFCLYLFNDSLSDSSGQIKSNIQVMTFMYFMNYTSDSFLRNFSAKDIEESQYQNH